MLNEQNSKEKTLEKMISKKTISLNVDVKNWQEAVKIGGQLLVDVDAVEERYIGAMVETVKTLGPYIVIAPGIAMPHARPEDGVKEPCMSLITLKNPVNFGNEHNDPVKVVISFGTIDKKAHVEALTSIARIIGDPEKLEIIKNAQKSEVIEDIIAGK